MNILITGATGFLGSYIAQELVQNGHSLLVAKRSTSNTWRCSEFKSKVQWLNTTDTQWVEIAVDFQPQVIIHCAWDGVGADGRGDWDKQVQNLVFQQSLLDIAKQCKTEKFISVGSQAEYGEFNGVINEDTPANPNSAYGAVKQAAQTIIKTFCELNNIKWYWFRQFSIFGEKEADNWLIPSTIKNIVTGESMDFTGCEQKYSYMYVKDVAHAYASCALGDAPSGVYNISGSVARPLKDIITHIRNRIKPTFTLNFGALPYRYGQSMHNQGDVTKIIKYIVEMEDVNFEEKLNQTIEYYKTIYQSNNE